MARETLHLVTLRRTRYNDRHSIVTAWSRERGRVSLLVSEGSGRGATRLRALMVIPSMVECQADTRPGRDILPVNSPVSMDTLSSLRANPVKAMVATVLAELLDAALREGAGGPDPAMSDFIEVSLQALDALTDATAIANFHLYFGYRLMCLLGVEPDMSTYRPGRLLDMVDGIFRDTPPLHPHFLDPDKSTEAHTLSQLTLATIGSLKLKRAERNKAFDTMLDYLALHGAATQSGLKSLDVMRSLF